ncbi:methylenetetrahydrofolate reductase [Nitriliruptor alkaliphilus]|uniref:methylenetetrahydrofolate reductase n=1 Tax=Nitriliruptor alkaliphilus TaxID=427918 RepID=UPI001B80673C|nr:methylenetetrahydrofolate reductase [Nitriliruptor alkaliphilus]
MSFDTSVRSMAPRVRDDLAATLERARFEILPIAGVDEQIAHLPAGAAVTVTASPSKGIDATLDLCARLVDRDLQVIPHLSARLVRDRRHLADLLRRLRDLGIDAAFVVAGDAPEAAGPYEGAADLLREMADLGHELREIGITGYPESHAFIPDDDTIRAMSDKAPYATHIVSQICYDPAVIVGWIQAVRARGITLPIHLGIPGAVDRAKLVRISMRVGLGDSVRFLRKQSGVVSRLLTGYTADDLVSELAETVADRDSGVAGWHLFTFNHVDQTERWRQQLLAQLRTTADDRVTDTDQRRAPRRGARA